MTYGVYVTYHYIAYNGFDRFVGEIMALDFVPNTPSGIEKITDIIRKKKIITTPITILGMIPLVNDRKPVSEDEWE